MRNLLSHWWTRISEELRYVYRLTQKAGHPVVFCEKQMQLAAIRDEDYPHGAFPKRPNDSRPAILAQITNLKDNSGEAHGKNLKARRLHSFGWPLPWLIRRAESKTTRRRRLQSQSAIELLEHRRLLATYNLTERTDINLGEPRIFSTDGYYQTNLGLEQVGHGVAAYYPSMAGNGATNVLPSDRTDYLMSQNGLAIVRESVVDQQTRLNVHNVYAVTPGAERLTRQITGRSLISEMVFSPLPAGLSNASGGTSLYYVSSNPIVGQASGIELYHAPVLPKADPYTGATTEVGRYSASATSETSLYVTDFSGLTFHNNQLYYFANEPLDNLGNYRYGLYVLMPDGKSGLVQEFAVFNIIQSNRSFAVIGKPVSTSVGMLWWGYDYRSGGEPYINGSLLKDISPGFGSSLGGTEFWDVGGTVYFMADDGVHGYELWKTNGFGAQLVADIHPGALGAFPDSTALSVLNGQLVFSADDGIHGRELWITDNTASGAHLIRDLNPGIGNGVEINGSSQSDSYALGGSVLFGGNNGSGDVELWQTDGTSWGTSLVSNIKANGSSNPGAFQKVGSDVFLSASNSQHNVSRLYSINLGSSSPPIVTISTIEGRAGEGGLQTLRFRVSRSGSTSAALPVTFTVSGTASSNDFNITLPSGFAVGEQSFDIVVSPVVDHVNEPEETVVVSISDSNSYTIDSSFAYGAIQDVVVNAAPRGTTATVTTLEDTLFSFTAGSFGFSDPENNPQNGLQAVKLTTLPANGSLRLNGVPITTEGLFVSAADINAGKLKFRPPLNANGVSYTSFTFQVQDDAGTSNGGVDLDPTPRMLTIDVTPVNDAPVPQQDPELDPITITVRMGFPLSYHFASNTFLDPEGDNFTLSASDPNGNGLPFAPYILSFQPGPGSGEGTLTGTPSQSNLLLHNPYPPNLKQYIQIAATDSSGQIGFTKVELTFEASPHAASAMTVYVDPTFHLTAPDDPDGDGPATELGYDAFDDIQTAIEAVADDGKIVIRGGEYSTPPGSVVTTGEGRFKPVTLALGGGIDGEGIARVVVHGSLQLDPRTTLQIDLVARGTVAGVDFDQLVVANRINLQGANLVLSGTLIRQQGINYDVLQSNSIVDQFSNLNAENTISLNNRTLKVSYLTGTQPGFVRVSYYVPASPTGFLVNSGQAQRSIIFRIDVTFGSSLGLSEMIALGRIKLAHYDTNGNPIASESDVVLTSRIVTRIGSTLRFDFTNSNLAISNNYSNAGDGYYKLKFDLDGSNAFATTRTFARLWGDFDGDKNVNPTSAPTSDTNALDALISHGTISSALVNSQRMALLRNKGRKLNGNWTLDN